MTDSELKEFSLDFETIAGQIPANVEINGEIISGDLATVTANLPADDDDTNEIQTIRLRHQNGIWVILTVEHAAEARIRKEGKAYFYNLKVETHEQEARDMLERISKAQLAYSLQHGGNYTGLDGLIEAGLLPADAKTSERTGYNYSIDLRSPKQTIYGYRDTGCIWQDRSTFVPAQAGRKGHVPRLSRDNRGKPILP